MLFSCAFLYAMKRWEIISFTVGEPQSFTGNARTLVPVKTLFCTIPLALAYLVYMVCTFVCICIFDIFLLETLIVVLDHVYLFVIWWKLVSMESVRSINVPMYTTLRRTTVAFTMIVEYLLVGQKHSFYVIGRYEAFLN